jgi:ComF family protein
MVISRFRVKAECGLISVMEQVAHRKPRFWAQHGQLGLRRLLDLVYPPQCVACSKAIDEPHGLCASCWGQIRFIARPFCERLGTPFAVDLGGPLLSPAAMADPPVYRRARVAAAYDGPAGEMVRRLKFGDQMPIAIPMARMMAQAGTELLADAALMLPVPSHRWRLFHRRFNQSVLLGRKISAASGIPMADDVLLRHRSTLPQTRLTKAQRQQNVSGSFSVPKSQQHRIEGKAIVLVDDVITTGSTANAASRVLLRAGAASVDVLAFAMVVDQT